MKKCAASTLNLSWWIKQLCCVLVLSVASLAQASEPQTAAPRVSVHAENGTQHFNVELADDSHSRATGLMHRQTLAADQGMLFIYHTAKARYFWMKNTQIPLDIIFVSADWKIIHIAQAEPESTKRISSTGQAQYVLEINRGLSELNGFKAGDKISFNGNRNFIEKTID